MRFELLESSRQRSVRTQEFTQANKRSDDLDARFDRPVAADHGRRHDCAMFGESVREILSRRGVRLVVYRFVKGRPAGFV
jgi:hypothetical protein